MTPGAFRAFAAGVVYNERRQVDRLLLDGGPWPVDCDGRTIQVTVPVSEQFGNALIRRGPDPDRMDWIPGRDGTASLCYAVVSRWRRPDATGAFTLADRMLSVTAYEGEDIVAGYLGSMLYRVENLEQAAQP